jgi:putative tricarboxylic transport membrane protein
MTSVWKPEREIEILAGTPPGGGLDRTARTLAAALSSISIANRVVNVPGDGARRVWTSVDARAGDAHVLCISSPNLTTDYLTGVAAFNHDSYTPLAILYNEYIAFVARSDSSNRYYGSGGDLLKRLRTDTAKVTVALSTAAGNPNHIALAQVTRHAGGDVCAPVIRVFDSALDAVADVVAGNADVAAVTAASAVKELEAGTCRALAVSSPTRLAGWYAQTPTWLELGAPCTLGAWRGVHGARGLNADQIAWWESTLTQATRAASWPAELARHDWTPMLVTGAALREHLLHEQTQMRAVLIELGFKNT